MDREPVRPKGLLLRLLLYFGILFAGLGAITIAAPEAARYLPLGGTDAIEIARIEIDQDSITIRRDALEEVTETAQPEITADQIAMIVFYLALSMLGTILVMLPITWVYTASKREIGYRKSFVRALIILPICATTIVLLIQDSLALAFGLAAMVAAVRFRVALQEAIDGIYIFAAICVGLAAGIGYLGIALIMATFFCFTNAVLWLVDYGRNPIDDATHARKIAKLESAE